MNKEFLDAIEANPIIAAVKDEQGLQNCLGREELTVIFILYGDIRSIGGIVERIHQDALCTPTLRPTALSGKCR